MRLRHGGARRVFGRGICGAAGRLRVAGGNVVLTVPQSSIHGVALGLSPIALNTSPARTRSCATKAANSAGEFPTGIIVCATRNSLIFGCSSVLAISEASVSTIAAGVLAGAHTPK